MDGDVEVGAGALPRSVLGGSPGRIDLIVREGRGRLGGTMFLDLLIQRARENGRARRGGR